MKVLISAANAKALIDQSFDDYKLRHPSAKLLFETLDHENKYTVTVTFIGEGTWCITRSCENESKAMRMAQVWQDIMITLIANGFPK